MSSQQAVRGLWRGQNEFGVGALDVYRRNTGRWYEAKVKGKAVYITYPEAACSVIDLSYAFGCFPVCQTRTTASVGTARSCFAAEGFPV